MSGNNTVTSHPLTIPDDVVLGAFGCDPGPGPGKYCSSNERDREKEFWKKICPAPFKSKEGTTAGRKAFEKCLPEFNNSMSDLQLSYMCLVGGLDEYDIGLSGVKACQGLFERIPKLKTMNASPADRFKDFSTGEQWEQQQMVK